MIPLPHRTKGGAKGPHQSGPFGEWPDEDDLDDGQDDEDDPGQRIPEQQPEH